MVERLDEVEVKAGLLRAAAVLVLPVTRDGHDKPSSLQGGGGKSSSSSSFASPEPRGDLVAVHPGKPDVKEDEFGPELACDFKGFVPVMGRRHVVPDEPQKPHHPASRVRVVIDDEDPGTSCLLSLPVLTPSPR